MQEHFDVVDLVNDFVHVVVYNYDPVFNSFSLIIKSIHMSQEICVDHFVQLLSQGVKLLADFDFCRSEIHNDDTKVVLVIDLKLNVPKDLA